MYCPNIFPLYPPEYDNYKCLVATISAPAPPYTNGRTTVSSSHNLFLIWTGFWLRRQNTYIKFEIKIMKILL